MFWSFRQGAKIVAIEIAKVLYNVHCAVECHFVTF